MISFHRIRVPSSFLILVLFSFSAMNLSCGRVGDFFRNWGTRERRKRVEKLSSADLERWTTDLKISQEKSQELHRDIQNLVQESALQGDLSWKIARAYMQADRFDQASVYYRAAIENRLADDAGPGTGKVDFFEDAIPYFNEALKRHVPDPQLLYEAGLCYANASRNLGWEEGRWRTAVLLLDRMRSMRPDDTRPLYELALLYAKTTDEKLRDTEFALKLLDEAIRKEENNIPALFARAHIRVEAGDLESARTDYATIQERLRDLHGSGMLSGPVERDSRYIQAGKNREQLELCIQGSPQCEIFVRKQ